jgi:histidinol dehydrogenase
VKRLNCADADFEAGFAQLMARAGGAEPQVADVVREIIARVRRDGDAAVTHYTNQFDRVELGLGRIRISPEEIAAASASISDELRAALELAAARITAFHKAQMPAGVEFTDAAGAKMRWGFMCRGARHRTRHRF